MHEEPHYLHSLLEIEMIKLRMRWALHVAHMEKDKNFDCKT